MVYQIRTHPRELDEVLFWRPNTPSTEVSLHVSNFSFFYSVEVDPLKELLLSSLVIFGGSTGIRVPQMLQHHLYPSVSCFIVMLPLLHDGHL